MNSMEYTAIKSTLYKVSLFISNRFSMKITIGLLVSPAVSFYILWVTVCIKLLSTEEERLKWSLWTHFIAVKIVYFGIWIQFESYCAYVSLSFRCCVVYSIVNLCSYIDCKNLLVKFSLECVRVRMLERERE